METCRWVHSRESGTVRVFQVPSFQLKYTFTPASLTNFRYGLSDSFIVFAGLKAQTSFKPSSFPTETGTLEVYNLSSGALELTSTLPIVNQNSSSLILVGDMIIDIGVCPQVINWRTGKRRLVLRDIDSPYKSIESSGVCYHGNSTLILCYGDGFLRISENGLGNYSQTRLIPRHIKCRETDHPAVISVDTDSVLIYGGMRNSVPVKAAFLYNTKLKYAEMCGNMPGRGGLIESHTVWNGSLYALLKGGKAMSCDLTLGVAKMWDLKEWKEVAGLIWAHQKGIVRVSICVLKVIVLQYTKSAL